MASEPETIPSCLLMTSSDRTNEEILARLASLEEVEQLWKEDQELQEENGQSVLPNRGFGSRVELM